MGLPALVKVLWNLLVAHLDAQRQQQPPPLTGPIPDVARRYYLINYDRVLSRLESAGYPITIETLSYLLRLVAEECERNRWPPLNALVVKLVKGVLTVPGQGYERAGGFSEVSWPNDCDKAVRFQFQAVP
jgi:hypothetical protein